MLRRILAQRAGKPSHMVLVGVGAHHVIQRVHPLVGQVGDHQAGVGHIASVDEHTLSAAEDQRGIRLPHVDIVNLQRALRWGGGGRALPFSPAGRRAQRQQQRQDQIFNNSHFFVLPFPLCQIGSMLFEMHHYG